MYCTNTHIHKTKRKNTTTAAFNQNITLFHTTDWSKKSGNPATKFFKLKRPVLKIHIGYIRSLKCFSVLICFLYLQLTERCWILKCFFLSAYILGRKYSFIAVGRFYRKCTRRVLGTSPRERKIFPEHSGDPEIAAWQEFHHKYRCSFTKTEPLKKQ